MLGGGEQSWKMDPEGSGMIMGPKGISIHPSEKKKFEQARLRMGSEYRLQAGEHLVQSEAYKKQEEAKQIAGGGKPTP